MNLLSIYAFVCVIVAILNGDDLFCGKSKEFSLNAENIEIFAR